jgi:exopolyphosphatase/pppGpp-phosphohydrolase
MSINAINSVSLYEYYYTINQNQTKKKSSPIAKEMQKYGLTPTDDEELNIAILQKAKHTAQPNNPEENSEISASNRPWADLMYQLGLTFNKDPKDDIEDIKNELAKLISDVNDDELNSEVHDLESYIENLYLNYTKNSSSSINLSTTLSDQLNNLSMLNQVNLK